MRILRGCSVLIAAVLGMTISASSASAQGGAATTPPKPKGTPARPCCEITAIDAGTGMVTAKDSATGKVFYFKPAQAADGKLVGTLKVGQKVWADLTTGKVSVVAGTPCCRVVDADGMPTHPQQ